MRWKKLPLPDLSGLLAMMFAVLICPAAAEAEPANILWIIADDLGPELGCYGYSSVATPNIDRLAAEGTRYTLAFSTSPVCSASRTALQTGLYQTTVGGHHHDTRDKRPLPDSIETVTALMQKAGYFVSNGTGVATPETRVAKSHFNFVYKASEFFDGSDWSQRAEGQPFFATVQIKEPHRPFVKSQRPRPDAVIPPYYPQHPVTQADWGNYLASIEVLDQKVGKVLHRLDSEGLVDNTMVFFFGDHGRPHVRGKQWLYDGGLHVPLLIRWPSKVAAGAVNNQLTSLLDLMPTTLAAAGLKAPELPGHNLLDAAWRGHKQLFAARDRCGDAADRIRSVRTRDFKYIRNFHPELPYLQHSGYKKLSYPVEALMKVLHARGEWDSPFMAKTRPAEELYDLNSDPFEMTNLSADPAFADQLAELRSSLDQWIVETVDMGAIDESTTVDLDAVMREKWKSYANVMKKRGLAAETSDEDYLDWWRSELAVPESASR